MCAELLHPSFHPLLKLSFPFSSHDDAHSHHPRRLQRVLRRIILIHRRGQVRFALYIDPHSHLGLRTRHTSFSSFVQLPVRFPYLSVLSRTCCFRVSAPNGYSIPHIQNSYILRASLQAVRCGLGAYKKGGHERRTPIPFIPYQAITSGIAHVCLLGVGRLRGGHFG